MRRRHKITAMPTSLFGPDYISDSDIANQRGTGERLRRLSHHVKNSAVSS